MTSTVPRAALAAVTLLFLVPAFASAASFAGVYEIRSGGKVIGAEKFEIDMDEDGAYVVKSSGTVKDESVDQSAVNDYTELAVKAGGVFRDYQREVYVDRLPRKLAMVYDGFRFLVKLNTGEASLERKIEGPASAAVVDAGVFSHFGALVHRAVMQKILGKSIPVVVPSEMVETTAYVDDRGDDTAALAGGNFAARRYFIDLDTYGVSAWADGSGRLIRIEIPATGAVAELQGYKGTTREAPAPRRVPSTVETGEASFQGGEGIAGTPRPMLKALVRRPRGDHPDLPAVLFLSDTGGQDARGVDFVTGLDTLTGALCDKIAESGFVVMSYADRGVGGSQGDLAQSALSVLEADASRALDNLLAQPGVDAARVALVGHGEGGNVALRLAAKRPEIAAVIVLAPSPVSLTELALEQARRRLAAMGQRDDPDAMTDHPVAIAIRRAREGDEEFTVIGGRPVYLDLYRQWDKLNPAADLAAAKAPVLHVTMEKDQQIFDGMAAPLVKAGEKKGGYAHKRFDGLDHFLVRGRGRIAGYSDPDRALDDDAVGFLVRWLRENAGA
ncbi:MAG: alpha/beta hydrolase [Deltaproteobacteria bacterium]|nr:alpha/beta hydrolase [Deltaproteobacteria bacterium]